jgi:putative Holliday junction resolvase
MKLIGIDYGRRRIGLAVSDETRTCVRGLPTIDRRRTPDVLHELFAVIAAEKPAGIVFGLPLDQDDRETPLSAEIRKFAANLEKNLAIPVYYIDESFTSKQATDLLLSRRKKERRNKATVDRMAACLILESFLRDMKCEHADP